MIIDNVNSRTVILEKRGNIKCLMFSLYFSLWTLGSHGVVRGNHTEHSVLTEWRIQDSGRLLWGEFIEESCRHSGELWKRRVQKIWMGFPLRLWLDSKLHIYRGRHREFRQKMTYQGKRTTIRKQSATIPSFQRIEWWLNLKWSK